jgi:hypothetical protein
VHRPVIEALKLTKRYDAQTTNATQYYAAGETVPIEARQTPGSSGR